MCAALNGIICIDSCTAHRLSWHDTPEDKESQGSILGLAISPDGKTLATAQMGNKLKLWNLADGRLLQEIDTKTAEVGAQPIAKVAGLFFADEGHKLVAVARKVARRAAGRLECPGGGQRGIDCLAKLPGCFVSRWDRVHRIRDERRLIRNRPSPTSGGIASRRRRPR